MKKINTNPLEIEEIFLDDMLHKREEHWETFSRKIESPLEKRRFFLFSVLGVLVLLFILGFAFKLQIFDYEEYKALALENKFVNLKIKAERGIIYDRNMEPLVMNEAAFDLWLDKTEMPSKDVLEDVSEIIDMDIEDSEQELILVKENLSHFELVLLEATQPLGFKINKIIKRNYAQESSLSHILGYLGKISPDEFVSFDERYEFADYVGKEGLEKVYEEVLVENKGVIEIERDARGNQISKHIKSNPSSGNSLILNLDLGLQKRLASALRSTLYQGNGEAAAGIVIDPRTGGILASVSVPSFDNNMFARGITQKELEKLNNMQGNPQLNRVIGGNYAVGSTIKPFVGTAALEEEIITEETTFFCPEKLCLENEFTYELECFADWTFHGETDIRKAIAESVNPFFYIIGGGYERPKYSIVDYRLPKYFEGLGSRKLAYWLEQFGWANETGVDLPGEVQGRIPTREWKQEYFSTAIGRKWYLGDTYNMSIGQGYLLATPIQVASAFQAIVNNGTIYKPKLVNRIISDDGEEKIETEVLAQVPADPNTFEIIRQGMRQAVASPSGSAYRLNYLPIAVKTGTAETGKEDVYHNWISLFAPYDDPEIIMVIIVENVKGTRIVAQNIAAEVLEWYFRD